MTELKNFKNIKEIARKSVRRERGGDIERYERLSERNRKEKEG